MEAVSPLFTPLSLGPLRLPNRLVMAPMTRSRAVEGNVPGPLAPAYYAQRADAGLLITEGSQVAPEGQGYLNTPGIHTDAQVEGWRAVTDAVHAAGGRIALQLWHVGRISHPSFQPGGALPVAPSAVQGEGTAYTAEGPQPLPTPRALETREIADVVAQFADGARRALDAGFDGVEIHGANGYLIEQFLFSGSNRRTDRYGGPVANRVRFLREVAEAVSAVWGPERVGVRLSPKGTNGGSHDDDRVATALGAVRALAEVGVGFIHLIEPQPGHSMLAAEVAHLPLIPPLARAIYGGAIIANGGHTSRTGQALVASGAADLIAYGVPFLANPDLAERFRRHAPLNAADPATFYGGDARGYTDYPTLEEAAVGVD